MARYDLEGAKAMMRENGTRRARVTIPVEILRFCGPAQIAAKLRSCIKERGLHDNISMKQGILYHTINVEMEGPAIEMIPIVEAIEKLESKEEE